MTVSSQQPKQSFSKTVKQFIYANRNGISNQAQLAFKSGLSKTTVSRILRDSNDKGKGYRPTWEIVMSVCIAFRLSTDEAITLFLTAFPELALWQKILEERLDIDSANVLLDESGCPMLSNITE